MAKRKQTPDVLADILGGETTLLKPESTQPVKPVQASSPEKRQPPAWDYAIVTFQDYKGWRPRYINGRELKDWMSGSLIHEYLGAMGDEGWELAAASSGERMYGSADLHQLYFRRKQ